MQVYISNYRHHWISPYTMLEKICFWEKDKDVFYNLEDDPNHKYEKTTNVLTYVSRGIKWVLDLIHPRINYVKIDYYDTWNMDSTLSDIILPMLKQLKENQHGAPFVEDEDVPKELRSIYALPREPWDTDGNHFKRWEWVLDEMIFAFEHKLNDDWQDEFRSGEVDWKHVPCQWDENGKATLFKMEEGTNHTYKCDYDAIAEVQKRIDNGLRLFGKYYQGLWD